MILRFGVKSARTKGAEACCVCVCVHALAGSNCNSLLSIAMKLLLGWPVFALEFCFPRVGKCRQTG